MPSATIKDALYLLNFQNGALVRSPVARPGAKPAWRLEPGAVPVPTSVAEALRRYSIKRVEGEGRAGEEWYRVRPA